MKKRISYLIKINVILFSFLIFFLNTLSCTSVGEEGSPIQFIKKNKSVKINGLNYQTKGNLFEDLDQNDDPSEVIKTQIAQLQEEKERLINFENKMDETIKEYSTDKEVKQTFFAEMFNVFSYKSLFSVDEKLKISSKLFELLIEESEELKRSFIFYRNQEKKDFYKIIKESNTDLRKVPENQLFDFLFFLFQNKDKDFFTDMHDKVLELVILKHLGHIQTDYQIINDQNQLNLTRGQLDYLFSSTIIPNMIDQLKMENHDIIGSFKFDRDFYKYYYINDIPFIYYLDILKNVSYFLQKS